MALFKIDTTSGGIQMPSNFFGGPLSSLYTKGGLDYTQYPRDLGSEAKQHSVLFTIEEIKELGTEGLKTYSGEIIDSTSDAFGKLDLTSIGDSVGNFFTGLFSSAKDTIENNDAAGVAKTVTNSAIDGAAAMAKATGQMANIVSNRSGTPVAYIELYMPESLVFSSNMSYDDSTTLAGAAGALPLIGDVVSKVTSGLQSDVAKLALNKAGYVFNPQKQMLFQGVEFRQFNMTFTFTPYSKDEALAVKEIIKTFRKWSAPKISDSFGGMFWVPPALFNIDFRFKGGANQNIPKLDKCVVESVEVNYAPNGWTAHADGAPVQTQMTVSFQEIKLIDRDMIEKGY